MDRCESIEGDNIICKHSKLQFGITSGTLLHTHTQYLKASDSTSKKHTLDVCTFVCVLLFSLSSFLLFETIYSNETKHLLLLYELRYASMLRCFPNEIWKWNLEKIGARKAWYTQEAVCWVEVDTGTHSRSFAHFRQQNQMTNFHYVFSKQKKNIAYTCCVAQTL